MARLSWNEVFLDGATPRAKQGRRVLRRQTTVVKPGTTGMMLAEVGGFPPGRGAPSGLSHYESRTIQMSRMSSPWNGIGLTIGALLALGTFGCQPASPVPDTPSSPPGLA